MSHTQLLLRSTPDPEHPTQIDIRFKVVEHALLHSPYENLRLRVASEADCSHIAQIVGETRGPHYYVLSDSPFSFVVAATDLVWVETEANFWDDSPLLVLSSCGLVQMTPSKTPGS